MPAPPPSLPQKCRLCRSPLPEPGALVCPECGKPQTRLQEFVENHSVEIELAKLLLTALLIPFLLWLVSFSHDSREKARDTASTRYAEIVAALPRISAAQMLLYEPCVGTNSESCAASVDAALGEYLKAENDFGEVIVRHFPELKPSVILLSSLDHAISFEVSSLWQEYFACVEAYKEVLGCADQRRRYPLRSLQVAKFLIDFLDCKASLSLAQQLGSDAAPSCEAIIRARSGIALDRPTQAMRSFDGIRVPREISKIHDEIWTRYLVPGSNLEQDIQNEESKEPPPAAPSHQP
jgi:hypothetical protein